MKKSIAIIGGGASALMLAATLDTQKYTITIYEKNVALGRKFLVAGDGGFNLTHSEIIENFILQYTPSIFLKNCLLQFTNEDFRGWLKNIGIETFVGTSKRVYPIKGIKPIQVLNAILKIIKQNKVIVKTKHCWQGWDEKNHLVFENSDEKIKADIVVFALGGGSWKVTGTNDEWLTYFKTKNIQTIPFQASNCAYKVNWEQHFALTNEGKPLKNISITCNHKTKNGEIVITKNGIEGGAIYALSSAIREDLNANNKAIVFFDLKPSLSLLNITEKLENSNGRNITDSLKKNLNFSTLQIALLKTILSKEEFNSVEKLSAFIKKLPLEIIGFDLLDNAISTVGGIDLNELNEHFEFTKLQNHYALGEMLNWDAPTGGYLLQACFSMGFFLAQYLNNKE